MSRRATGRPRRRREGAGRWTDLVGVAAAAALGAALAPGVWAHLGPPVPLDPAKWAVVCFGMDEQDPNKGLAAGTGLVDGALMLSMRGLGVADVLSPVDQRAVRVLELTLARDSDVLGVGIRDGAGTVSQPLQASPEGWILPGAATLTPWQTPRTVHLDLAGPRALVDGVPTGAAPVGALELHAQAGTARIEAIRVTDTNGEVYIDQSFGAPDPGVRVRAGVALLFATVAGALVLVARAAPSRAAGLAGALAALFLPAVVIATPFARWRGLAERLYLVHTSASDLRILVFEFALAPLAAAALLATGALTLHDGGRKAPAPLVAGILAVVAGLASRDLHGLSLLVAVPGLAFLALPWRSVVQLGLPSGRVLQRDLPALVAVGALGWGAGLLPAVAWRLLVLWADTPMFLARSARLGTDTLLLTLAALPVGVEGAVRSTYLDVAWDPVTLAGNSDDTVGRSVEFKPFWQGSCGADPKVLYTFGGSSAGGAYQFKGDPTAFFPSKVHARLCEAGVAVRSINYANSGRDSFDAASAVDRLFAAEPPDAVVLYLGVNDLLTADSALTRKERAAKLAANRSVAAGLDTLSSKLRTLSGLSLLLAPTVAWKPVVAVPLADAEENLRHIATAANAPVLFVTEYTQSSVAPQLAQYDALEQRLAGELAGSAFIDLRAALGPEGSKLLLDRNHLTREGSEAVGDLLAPHVQRALGAPATPPPPTSAPGAGSAPAGPG